VIDHDAWLQANDRYLAAGLHWLRTRLEWFAAPADDRARDDLVAALAVPAAAAAPPRRRRWRRRPEPVATTTAVPVATRAKAKPISDEQVADAAAAMEEAAASIDPPPALISLAAVLGLTPAEREVLLLCAGMELDPRLGELCARAHGDQRCAYPTFALALALFPDRSWDMLSPAGGLRSWRLIEIVAEPGEPLTMARLRADERIVNHIKGMAHLDDRLEPLLAPIALDPTDVQLPASQQRIADEIVAHWSRRPPGTPLDLVQLLGIDGASKEAIAAHVSAALGAQQLYRLPADLLPAHLDDVETLARLWQRESILLSLALYLDAQELDGATAVDPASNAVRRFVGRSPSVFLLAARERWTGLHRADLAVDVQPPAASEQRDAWRTALGDDATDLPEQLSAQFQLSAGTIATIAARARAADGRGGDAFARELWDACLATTRPRLDALAQRLEPKATWDDLVLAENELSLLRQIAAQVAARSTVYERWGFGARMNRGLGISVLFAGPSGTGKTMAAEVIANDLRLSLYRIDLSAVVSKYIGETEKNLRRLFDAAEAGGALLLFDEADALFGKRSEVKDSHDRYANIEINYLLQRMEGYRGLAILATNAKSALDTAFLRRLRFVVDFPFPGRDERRAIWRQVFPSQTPTEELDFDRLASMPATGGTIHNIALNAAFVAARAAVPVDMALILEAARTEFRKLDQPLPDVALARGRARREAVTV
jgi:ATPase family associated with various cellular activities (AAA)